MDPIATPALALAAVLLVIVLGVLAVLFAVKLFTWIGYAIRHVFRFVSGEFLDVMRLIGATVTGILMIPLVLLNIVIGRWSAAAHFGRGFTGELKNIGQSIYRIAIGHPARFLGLSALTEGVEKRMPVMVAQAPGADAPSKRVGQFDGYKIVGSLAGGGSGGKLYVAEPDATKRAVFARLGRGDLQQVVIKSFSLQDGSSLPQIVRESRALDAARKLGLVLDHDLTPERFYYVMQYVPGQSLSLVTQQLHTASAPGGLDEGPLRQAMAYVVDLLRTLETYHRGGLWHKDVKPDNIIVDGRKAHLVDFGLVTPLRSAMTLTTHGTEYFRDPELVRMALKGVKVHEVDGTRFDLFAVGAVMYSIIENSFPAHGVLSQISKRCPDALRWVVRRAMTDYDKRYPTAAAMAEDLSFVAMSRDPYAVKPFELPSMREAEGVDNTAPSARLDPEIAAVAAAATPRAAAQGSDGQPSASPAGRAAPKLAMANWWTGKYEAKSSEARGMPVGSAHRAPGDSVPPFAAPMAAGMAARRAPLADAPRRPAAEQLARARARVEAARSRSSSRLARRRTTAKPRSKFDNQPNTGIWVATAVFLGICVFGGSTWLRSMNGGANSPTIDVNDENEPEVTMGEDGEPSWAHVTMPVQPMQPAAPAVVSVSASVPMVYEIGRDAGDTKPAVKREAKPNATVRHADGKVLVIVDLPKPLSPSNQQAVTKLLERLSTAGFTLLGDFPGNPAAPAGLKAQLEQTARAIAECGQIGPDSDQARALLGEWINKGSGTDLVLWVRRADASADHESVTLEYFLVGPSPGELDESAKQVARARFDVGVQTLRNAD